MATLEQLLQGLICDFVMASNVGRLSSLTLPPFPPYNEPAKDWSDYEKCLRQHFVAFHVTNDQTCKMSSGYLLYGFNAVVSIAFCIVMPLIIAKSSAFRGSFPPRGQELPSSSFGSSTIFDEAVG